MKLKNYQYILMMGFAGSTADEWLAGVSLTVVNLFIYLFIYLLSILSKTGSHRRPGLQMCSPKLNIHTYIYIHIYIHTYNMDS